MENSEERIQVLSETAILVNLDAPPKLPFERAFWTGIESNTYVGSGSVRVEKREDGLYVDERKVILYLFKRQKNGWMSGHTCHQELSGKPVLHPNILDALLEHPNLIPEDWKKDDNGNTPYIFFWGVVFRNSVGYLCVRCLFFDGGGWFWSYGWLLNDWGDNLPAALLV